MLKHFFLYLFVFGAFVSVKSQSHSTPPGTLLLEESLYMDAIPVNNIAYLEFLRYRDQWTDSLRDTLKDLPKYGLTIQELEHKTGIDFTPEKTDDELTIIIGSGKFDPHNPKYQHYPILEISKAEAELYCQWRTDMVLLNWAITSKDAQERARYPLNILYRLPSEEDYKKALSKFGYFKKTFPAESSFGFSLYNNNYKKKPKTVVFIKDNLSEFTFDGLPYGNNWKHQNVDNTASELTTFRCVCEILD